MAFPKTRSMNTDLSEGMTDGLYKKVIQDRGGVVDPLTYATRKDLDDVWHGIHETPVKMAPDGLLHATPNYIRTAIANLREV